MGSGQWQGSFTAQQWQWQLPTMFAGSCFSLTSALLHASVYCFLFQPYCSPSPALLHSSVCCFLFQPYCSPSPALLLHASVCCAAPFLLQPSPTPVIITRPRPQPSYQSSFPLFLYYCSTIHSFHTLVLGWQVKKCQEKKETSHPLHITVTRMSSSDQMFSHFRQDKLSFFICFLPHWPIWFHPRYPHRTPSPPPPSLHSP